MNPIEPAFPRDWRHQGHNGLTTRAYMATEMMGAMMGAMMANGPYAADIRDMPEAARRAVLAADALIAALTEGEAQ